MGQVKRNLTWFQWLFKRKTLYSACQTQYISFYYFCSLFFFSPFFDDVCCWNSGKYSAKVIVCDMLEFGISHSNAKTSFWKFFQKDLNPFQRKFADTLENEMNRYCQGWEEPKARKISTDADQGSSSIIIISKIL